MSPPPKYSNDRIAHARGSPIQWIPDAALFTARGDWGRFGQRRARCGGLSYQII